MFYCNLMKPQPLQLVNMAGVILSEKYSLFREIKNCLMSVLFSILIIIAALLFCLQLYCKSIRTTWINTDLLSIEIGKLLLKENSHFALAGEELLLGMGHNKQHVTVQLLSRCSAAI